MYPALNLPPSTMDALYTGRLESQWRHTVCVITYRLAEQTWDARPDITKSRPVWKSSRPQQWRELREASISLVGNRQILQCRPLAEIHHSEPVAGQLIVIAVHFSRGSCHGPTGLAHAIEQQDRPGSIAYHLGRRK
jgi:hypothetical protein